MQRMGFGGSKSLKDISQVCVVCTGTTVSRYTSENMDGKRLEK